MAHSKTMGELFGVASNTITYHLQEIFKSGELVENSVTQIFRATASDGKKYNTKFYNLDAIISVGYRVNSMQATRFRQWASQTLKEYIIKGFVMNDEFLKNGPKFGKDYFDELLERIKEIRASERRFYQKVTDIYAQCSYDYDPQSPITKTFFKTVQNKLLFAITGHTAPEIIHERADSRLEHMGLTTWKNAPEGKVLKSDVTISKNYLQHEEMTGLNDIVTMYLDYAENQAKRNKLMSMQEWVDKLDSFLQFNEYDLLQNLDNVWYYFNASGYIVTGWQSIGGVWYYFEGSGAMVANRWVGNYYLQGDGSMATNKWIENYYVGADGAWIQ